MNKQKIEILILGFLMIGNSIFAQNIDSVKIEYSDWLKYKGLDKVFKVHTIEKQNKTLLLYLSFVYNDRDSIFSIWKSCNDEFSEKHDYSLNDLLFKTFVSISHKKPQLLNIQIYDTYDLSVEPCFYYKINWNNDTKQVVADSTFCKAKQPIL